MKTYSLFALILTALLLNGCARNLQGDTYSRDDARQVQQVQYGTVEAVRFVVIEGTKTPIGTIAGGAIGGIAGSTVGGGKGSQIAAVLGAVVGGLAGSMAEEELTKSQGVELIIRRQDNQESMAIVQADNPEIRFNIGDRVRLLSVNGQMRVSK